MNVIVEPQNCLLCKQPIGSEMSVRLYPGTDREWAAHVQCVYAWQRMKGKEPKA